jgi:hypothetical protein
MHLLGAPVPGARRRGRVGRAVAPAFLLIRPVRANALFCRMVCGNRSHSRRRRPPLVRAYASMGSRPDECVNCATRFTRRTSGLHGAIRRPGPSGDLSLCNACGVAFKRRGYEGLRARAKAMAEARRAEAEARRAEAEARRAEAEAQCKSPLDDLVEAAIGVVAPRGVPTGPRMVRVLHAPRGQRAMGLVCLRRCV